MHYAKYKKIVDGKNVRYYDEVSHIKPDRFRRLRDKQYRIKASDLLTHEEFPVY